MGVYYNNTLIESANNIDELSNIPITNFDESLSFMDISAFCIAGIQEEYNEIMTNIGFEELEEAESGDDDDDDTKSEGKFKQFVDKVVGFFKNAWSKIAGFFKNVIIKIQSIVSNNSVFANKYSEDIKSGYKYLSSSQETEQRVIMYKSIIDIAKNPSSSFLDDNELIEIFNKVKGIHNKAMSDIYKDTTSDILEEELKKIYSDMCDSEDVSKSDILKILKKQLIGESKSVSIKTFVMAFDNAKNIIDALSKTNIEISNIKQMFNECKGILNRMIKDAKSFSKAYKKHAKEEKIEANSNVYTNCNAIVKFDKSILVIINCINSCSISSLHMVLKSAKLAAIKCINNSSYRVKENKNRIKKENESTSYVDSLFDFELV